MNTPETVAVRPVAAMLTVVGAGRGPPDHDVVVVDDLVVHGDAQVGEGGPVGLDGLGQVGSPDLVAVRVALDVIGGSISTGILKW